MPARSLDVQESALLRGALLLGAQALDRDPGQLAGQLAGRLGAAGGPGLEEMAEQARRRLDATWLRPASPTLVAPGGVLTTSFTLPEPDATAVALTAAGEVLTGASDGTVRWRGGFSGRVRMTLAPHRRAVTALAATPDGRTVVSGSADCTIGRWEPPGGTVATLGRLDDWVTAVAVTPDGRRVLAGGADGQVRGWAVGEPAGLRVHRLHADPVRALAFTPDGRAAVSAAEDGTLVRWSLDDPPGETAELAHEDDWVTSVAVLPGGRLLTGHAGGGVSLRDAAGTVLATLTGHLDAVSAAAGGDGGLAVTASVGHTIRVWDLTRAAEGTGRRFGAPETVAAAAVTGSGLGLTVDARTGRPALRAAGRDPRPSWSPDAVHGEPRSVALTPDGRVAVAGTHDATVAVWAPAHGTDPALLLGHADVVTAVAVTPNGRWAASGASDRTVRLWDLTLASEAVGLLGHGGPVTAVALTDDARLIAYTTGDAAVWLWEPGRSVQPRSCRASEGAPTAVALGGAGTGPVVVSGWRGGQVRRWDPAAGRTATLGRHDGPVTSAAVAPGARFAATTGADHTVRLWDLTGRVRDPAVFTADWPLLACAFTPPEPGRPGLVTCDAAGVIHRLEIVDP